MFPDNSVLLAKILDGDRVSLGLAMTLVESERPEDREKAALLLDRCEQQKEKIDTSFRFTISGAPGAGKSTLIGKLGQTAISHGHKIGVITIDPSSTISHGSILGDKSRMQELSNSEFAFIRSSPAGSLLGGIGRRSAELMTLLSVAGFDLIFLETVGVGQSEHIAWQLTDGFILLLLPGSGDELQGIKRGITELADIIAVNKSDGSGKASAAITRSHYQNAIHYLGAIRDGWNPKVLTCSAEDGTGVDELWEIMRLYMESRKSDDTLQTDRVRQKKFWIHWSLGIAAHKLLLENPVVNQKLREGLHTIEDHLTSMYKVEYEIEKIMDQLMSSSNLKYGNERV